jgi:diaminopimelate decarboxylase
MVSRLSLFPLTAMVSRGHLVIGGCDTINLAEQLGTPLYVFDEQTLRDRCAEFKNEFGRRYADTTVIYACKAFINRALAAILKEEEMGLDVVSAGELGIARSADFPLEKVYFHGNNKSADELDLALKLNIGRIVVDNFSELKMLAGMAEKQGYTPDILLRLTPGVDPHTHSYITTGAVDSKFGFSLSDGERAVTAAMSTTGLNLVGLHFHIGSLLFEVGPYLKSIDIVLNFAAEMKKKHAFELKELDVGGGFAVQYVVDAPAPPIAAYAEAMASCVIHKWRCIVPG